LKDAERDLEELVASTMLDEILFGFRSVGMVVVLCARVPLAPPH
jgi:hypothetical protein